MKGPDKNSKRSKRRLKRSKNGEFPKSKRQRKAEVLLAARVAEYTANPQNRESHHKFTKPGSLKRKK